MIKQIERRAANEDTKLATDTVLPAEETVTGLCLLARMGDHAATELLRENGRSVEAETTQQLEHFRAKGYLYQIS